MERGPSAYQRLLNDETVATVYVEIVDRDRVLVHDHYHAVHYLMSNGDTQYRTLDEIGIPAIRSLCEKHGVCLLDIDKDEKDPGWVIGDYADSDARVQELIRAIANCVDELFSTSSREP